jgi:DNA polymerase-3 subunit delta'
VLATIRSRCRRLLLRPLPETDVARAIAEATGRGANDPEVREAAKSSDGSVARGLALLEGAALGLRQRVLDLIAQLPNPDPRALHALGDALGGTDPATLETFMHLVNGWLSSRLDDTTQAKARLARIAETWERVNRAARDVETYNLERKPLVFSVFDALSETARA